jgi:hypothetical protein
MAVVKKVAFRGVKTPLVSIKNIQNSFRYSLNYSLIKGLRRRPYGKFEKLSLSTAFFCLFNDSGVVESFRMDQPE